jgi:hypothetical protein
MNYHTQLHKDYSRGITSGTAALTTYAVGGPKTEPTTYQTRDLLNPMEPVELEEGEQLNRRVKERPLESRLIFREARWANNQR